MTPFTLSRLETDIGTVKVEGRFNPIDGILRSMISLTWMATDGPM